MLDVHAPDTKIHGFRDFLVHLLTITVGLLIALSLEGCVEWQHHRHLVHDAEAGLRDEIRQNAQSVGLLRQQIKDENKRLDEDLVTLIQARKTPTTPHQELKLMFDMQTFDDVRWKTAQSTGAFAYMPYEDAKIYAYIYDDQSELYAVQQAVVNDVMNAGALVVTHPPEWQPTPAQIDAIVDRIGMVRMRLMLLSSFVDDLDRTYKKFESTHVE
jgi:hypothetical protein